MTERPYETSAPDDLTVGTTSSTAAPGGYSTGSTSSSQGTAGGGATSTVGAAGDEAKSVASDAKQSGQQVAQTAASGAKDVAHEATNQVRNLYTQLRSEFDDQASTQGQRAAQGVRSLADELRQMASSSEQQGIAGQAVGQVADRAHSVADWLESRQPREMLDDLRSLARRRPGAFLLGAAVLGVVGGRLTRGLTSDGSSGSNGSIGTGGQSGVAYTGTAGYSSTGGPGGTYGTVATETSASGAIPPSESPVRSEPYTVGVRDSDTHAVTSMTDGVTADPLDDSTETMESLEPVDPIAEAFPEGRGGAR
ncbi:hypothetical protein [Terrabacter sp. NPDC080008]|uniref:hypothetical protein n=1 Tax=Terrabacter sp. NPDC080008 TaxID=3155176 RepID=UPI003450AB94